MLKKMYVNYQPSVIQGSCDGMQLDFITLFCQIHDIIWDMIPKNWKLTQTYFSHFVYPSYRWKKMLMLRNWSENVLHLENSQGMSKLYSTS